MVVKSKSIFMPAEHEDGMRILVTRYYPRGVKKDHFDLWLRELSPSAELLLSYKEGKLSWSDFKIAYLDEMRESVDSLDAIHALNNEAPNRDITLLCYERLGQPCHRHLLRDIVELPSLLLAHFEPKDTDDEKGVFAPVLVSHQERLIV